MNRKLPVWLLAVLTFTILICITAWTTFMPSTAHAQDNFSCATVSEIPLEQCEALVAIYNANPESSLHDRNWLTAVTTCSGHPNLSPICTDGKLTILYLERTNLTSLPPEIGDLEDLTRLYLDDNGLTTLPVELGNLISLEALLLQNNQLTRIPEEILQLPKLHTFGIWGNPLEIDIRADFDCADVSDVSQLECEALVEIHNTNLDSNLRHSNWLIPHTICTWRDVTCTDGHVTDLDLVNRRLTTLPSEIGDLSYLTSLVVGDPDDLGHNVVLTTLPPEIGNLDNLISLDLNGNNLTTLPPEIGNLDNLTSLDLINNNLTILPPEIGNLDNLTSLYLWHNNLTTLPPEIGNLNNLTLLELYNNGLMTLPLEIGNLNNLTSLDLINNNLTALPLEIGNLSNLISLDLSWNNLTTLPQGIGNLTSLTTLDLTGNPLSSQPKPLFTYAQGLGMVNRSMSGPFYVEGTSIQLTANPSAGWSFVRWDGPEISDEQAQKQTITISIGQSDQTYTAYFEMNEGASGIYLPFAMK